MVWTWRNAAVLLEPVIRVRTVSGDSQDVGDRPFRS